MTRVQSWVDHLAEERVELLRAGIFGSYARGNWGVGSDVDIVLIVHESRTPFWQRALEWDASGLPVPAEVLVYTDDEWEMMAKRGDRFYRTIQKEAIWLLER